jgi:hypothetical protein
MSCTVTGDFTGQPLDLVNPDHVEISYTYSKVTLFYFANVATQPGNQFLVYFNGEIVDRHGQSGKSYSRTPRELVDLKTFAVIVIPGGLPDDYNPLCGVEVDMFEKVYKDITLPEDNYTCEGPPIEENINGTIRANYVKPEWDQKGHSICPNSKVTLKARTKLMNGELVDKPESSVRPVLVVRDYRFFTNFDFQAYKAARLRAVPCSPYRFVSYKTGNFVTLSDSGHVSLDEIDIKKL